MISQLERLNQKLKAPYACGADLCQCGELLAAVRALAVEMHEKATRYLNMNHLKKHKKQALRAMAA